ncbi:MAG TPA: response regulator [Steroidobacteraceae bacterium]|nr:response regulator [Steroidobacteraceae bacterium]
MIGGVARGMPGGPETESTAETETASILVADDDRLIVATLGRGLRAAGFQVIEAFDSASALELCIERAPSLAIIDYKMPGATGVELARLIAERTAVPVIFLSAYSDPPIVDDAIAAGAMTYLVKPIDIGQLLPVARSALQRARELRKLRTELKSAHSRGKVISTATGLVMSRFHISEKDAYERLRRQARSTRMRLEDVAAALLRATEEAARLCGE